MKFNARRCTLWREYVYRLAVVRQKSKINLSFIEDDEELKERLPEIHMKQRQEFHSSQGECMTRLNALDLFRFSLQSVNSEQPLDYEKMKQVADMYRGENDFTNFEAPWKKRILRDGTLELGRNTYTSVYKFDLSRNQHLKMNSKLDKLYENIEIYTFRVRASAFLYKQIRRMVGTALDVGFGRISLDEFKQLLYCTNDAKWKDGVNQTAPSSGLYLSKINYYLDSIDNYSYEYEEAQHITERKALKCRKQWLADN